MKQKAGSSMIEIMIALFFVTLVAVALLNLATINLSTSSYSVLRSKADTFAKATMEWLRSQRDTDWTTFVGHVGYWCMPNLNWEINSACATNNESQKISGTPLYRLVTIEETVPGSQVEATVQLSWTDNKGYHEVKQTTIFTNENY